MPDEIPDFALNIQRLAADSGLSQAELARRAGLTRDAFNRYHTGRTRPPTGKLVALAKLFGVHPNDIDADRLVLTKRTDVRSAEPFFVSESRNGDPGFANITLNMDMRITEVSKVLEIVRAEMDKAEE